MNCNLKFADSCEYFYEPLPKFSIDINNNLTAIATTTGILLFQLQPILEKANSSINYLKFWIPPSNYMLINNIDIDVSSFLFDLPQDNVYSLLLKDNIVGSMMNLRKKKFYMQSCKISPSKLIGEECVIATITDAGSLDIYVKLCYINGLNKYENIINVTDLHIQEFKRHWVDVTSSEALEKEKEALRRVSLHFARAITWTHLLSRQNQIHSKNKLVQTLYYSVLIAAYGDGRIVFWQLNQTPFENYKNATLTCIYEYQTDLQDITVMHWNKSIGNSGLLIIGSKTGKTIAIPVLNLVHNYVTLENPIVLCKDTDIAVDYIDTEHKNDYFIVYVIQKSHLLMHLLNKDGVVSQSEYNFGNLTVTGFQKTIYDSVLISTLTGVIKEFTTTIEDGKLILKIREIFVKIDWRKRNLYGIFLSKNNTILTFITHHYGYNYKGPLKMRIYNFYMNEDKALSLFLLADRISDCFDLLTVLKVRSAHEKILICNELPKNENYDELPISTLKKYYWIGHITEAIFDYIETITEYNIKQVSDILTLIHTQQSIYLLQEIIKELKDSEGISEFKRQVAHVSYTHLKDFVMQDFIEELELKKYYINHILNILDECASFKLVDDDLSCRICEKQLLGLSCSDGHTDNRCMLTNVPILVSKFRCSMCDKMIAEEAFAFTKITCCPICDSPLETLITGPTPPFEHVSFCKEDCLSNL